MSKMPAKKKSCFQITSVTQAQVAATSNTDDTESLEDPDESRTEDVSSEIFDVSRADLGVCDRSSSEETLNNVGGDAEAATVMTLHLSQEGQPAGPVNGGFSFRSAGGGLVNPHALAGVACSTAAGQPSVSTMATQQVTSVNTGLASTASLSQTPATTTTTTTTTTSCSSRFRVIKLDHGTGEPFRKGRWTCTEFYERDSEGSGMSRTVDSIKHAVTLDHNADRDSGLGATGGGSPSVSAPQAQDSASDSGYSVAQHGHPPEKPAYGSAPQIGSGASAFQPTGYSAGGPQPPQQQQGQGSMQTLAPQTLHPGGLNGVPQGVAMLQKSPIMPPASTQAQQFAYSAPSTQPEYRPFAPLLPQGSGTQTLPMASLSAGPPASQGPSPVLTPAGGLGLLGHSGELPGGPTPSVQAMGLQVSGGVPMGLPGGLQPQPPTTATAQNVPAAVPNASHSPAGVLSQANAGSGGTPQPQGARGGGAPTASSAGHGAGPAVGFAPDDSRRKSDALPQPSSVPGKDVMTRPLIPESLHLATPTVNSLFGISIPMDGDEDSASGASVVAIDNKIEQAMDLVKSHLMYAVREEVEVLKEQIKELYERNSVLERENAVLKSLANTDQLGQLTSQLSPVGSPSPPQLLPPTSTSTPLGLHQDGGQPLGTPQQPNVTSA